MVKNNKTFLGKTTCLIAQKIMTLQNLQNWPHMTSPSPYFHFRLINAISRVVKTCLWFRKHNFWYTCGSSNFAGNFCQNALSNCSNSFYIFLLPKPMDRLRAKFCIYITKKPLTFLDPTMPQVSEDIKRRIGDLSP